VELPPEVAAAKPVEAASLPHTASTLPLVALIGVLSLGAGLTLWGLSKRTA